MNLIATLLFFVLQQNTSPEEGISIWQFITGAGSIAALIVGGIIRSESNHTRTNTRLDHMENWMEETKPKIDQFEQFEGRIKPLEDYKAESEPTRIEAIKALEGIQGTLERIEGKVDDHHAELKDTLDKHDQRIRDLEKSSS